MDYRLIKALVVLGVPGVALGVFYLLLKGFGFQFSAISSTWAAVIALVFLLVVATITLYALSRWAPQRGSDNQKREIKVGSRVRLPEVAQLSLEGPAGPVNWHPEMNKYLGRQAVVTHKSNKGHPAVKLDVDSGKWWWAVDWLVPS